MKMMHGACALPCSNRSRTREAPTPTNISTKSEPDIEKKGRPASPATAREQRLARARRPDEECSLRQASAKLGELLGVLQELDDLLELDLRLIRAGDIGEGDFGRIAREQLRFGLAERERLRATGLHLLEDEQPDADEEDVRQEVAERAEDRGAGILRLDLDVRRAEPLHFLLRISDRKAYVEARNRALVHHDLVAELARDLLPGLDVHLRDVSARQLRIILRIGDGRSGLGAGAGELDEREGDQDDQDPERERLRHSRPVHLTLRRCIAIGHYCKLAM